MAESEVARFREQQALHEQAAQQGLSGLAIVASHARINARMEQEARYLLGLLSEGKQHEVLALMEQQDWGGDGEATMMKEQSTQED